MIKFFSGEHTRVVYGPPSLLHASAGTSWEASLQSEHSLEPRLSHPAFRRLQYEKLDESAWVRGKSEHS